MEIGTTHPDAPIRFLFSHAIELYLKAYLLLKGVTIEQLRSRSFGHNLDNLTAKAVSLGLAMPQEHCQAMALANEAILDRYIETGARRILLPDVFSEICAKLHEQIGSAVYRNAGLTRKPQPYHLA